MNFKAQKESDCTFSRKCPRQPLILHRDYMTAQMVLSTASYWLVQLSISGCWKYWLLFLCYTWTDVLGLEGLLYFSMESSAIFRFLFLLFCIRFSASMDQIAGRMERRSVNLWVWAKSVGAAEWKVYVCALERVD